MRSSPVEGAKAAGRGARSDRGWACPAGGSGDGVSAADGHSCCRRRGERAGRPGRGQVLHHVGVLREPAALLRRGAEDRFFHAYWHGRACRKGGKAAGQQATERPGWPGGATIRPNEHLRRALAIATLRTPGHRENVHNSPRQHCAWASILTVSRYGPLLVAWFFAWSGGRSDDLQPAGRVRHQGPLRCEDGRREQGGLRRRPPRIRRRGVSTSQAPRGRRQRKKRAMSAENDADQKNRTLRVLQSPGRA